MIEVRRYTTNSGKDVIGDWKNSSAAAVRRRQANAIDRHKTRN